MQHSHHALHQQALLQQQQQAHLMHSAAAAGRPIHHPQQHPLPPPQPLGPARPVQPAAPHPHPASQSSAALLPPKQQISSVLNALTSGGSQHFHSMDGYDLANLHAMNARYLQQLTTQRSYMQHPQRRRQQDMQPPSTALFAAKM
jgi:hypothetical protein